MPTNHPIQGIPQKGGRLIDRLPSGRRRKKPRLLRGRVRRVSCGYDGCSTYQSSQTHAKLGCCRVTDPGSRKVGGTLTCCQRQWQLAVARLHLAVRGKIPNGRCGTKGWLDLLSRFCGRNRHGCLEATIPSQRDELRRRPSEIPEGGISFHRGYARHCLFPGHRIAPNKDSSLEVIGNSEGFLLKTRT